MMNEEQRDLECLMQDASILLNPRSSGKTKTVIDTLIAENASLKERVKELEGEVRSYVSLYDGLHSEEEMIDARNNLRAALQEGGKLKANRKPGHPWDEPLTDTERGKKDE